MPAIPQGPFLPDRRTLVAGLVTEIAPRRASDVVTIGNATPDDLFVYGSADDAQGNANYIRITAGSRERIDIPSSSSYRYEGHGFHPNSTGLWLKAVQAGEVLLIWF